MISDDHRQREADSLTRRGFDGLYHPEPLASCGCSAGDLYPCGERPRECKPGVWGEVDGVHGIFPRKAVRP